MNENQDMQLAAINFAANFYKEEGWSVTSVTLDKFGYDLVCIKGNERQDVEVKGVSGIQSQFIISAKELELAQRNRFFVLCVVFSALGNPTFQRWTGQRMLQKFNFEPISYKAMIKPV